MQQDNWWASAPVVQPAPQTRPAQRQTPRRAPRPQFADDRDALIRTVIGEAANQGPQGMQAVAAVALNRSRSRGQTPTEVVLAPNQFEPWGTAASVNRLMSIRPDAPEYRAAAQAVDAALAGNDPTNGADHFYAPRAQAALGRDKPSFDNGTGRAIGDHLFFDLEGGNAQAQPPQADDGEWWKQAPVAREVDNVDQAALDAMNAANAPAPTARYTQDRPFIIRADLTGAEAEAQRQEALTIRKGEWVQEPDGTTYRAGADAYEDLRPDGASDDLAPGVQARTPTLGDKTRAFVSAAAEQVPFLDEAAVGASALLQGREYSDVRDDYRAMVGIDNQANRGARVAGGLTGAGLTLLAPGVKQGGGFIAGGANALDKVARASLLGAGTGVVYGAGAADGGARERIEGGLLGGLTGFGTGAVGQQVVNKLTQPATGAVSNARLLSREGVDLTPGQMASEVPVVGGLLRQLEEGASSIPFVGAPIAQARQQSVETFNRAAINRALQPLGQKVPKSVAPGYAQVEAAQEIVSLAYDDALNGVQMVPDRAFYDRIGATINKTLSEAGVPQVRQLSRQINDRVFRTLDAFDDPITGQQFKALESEFGNLARQNLEATDGASRALGRAYQEVQQALRDALMEQNPRAAEALRAANGAYARLMRVERAAGSTASQANDGVFSPTQLGQAVGQMGSRRASARGDALMQDLAVAGRNIIPSRTGDSGTATRGTITGLIGAGAAGVPVANVVAAPLIATSIAYSKPAQAILNAVYRASDSRAANEALTEFARLAQRTPALLPYYEDAVRHVAQLGQTQSPATQPALLSPPPPRQGLLAAN